MSTPAGLAGLVPDKVLGSLVNDRPWDETARSRSPSLHCQLEGGKSPRPDATTGPLQNRHDHAFVQVWSLTVFYSFYSLTSTPSGRNLRVTCEAEVRSRSRKDDLSLSNIPN